ncbi:CRISPR-associated helicase Cas3 domain protein [Escherichia coli STEC_O31]|nr:CRISPR-associated helicase Cas3 domain protein [Escherichia coli STEC_O31]
MRKYPLSLLKDKNIVTFFDFWGKTRRGEKDGATTITFFAGIRWM